MDCFAKCAMLYIWLVSEYASVMWSIFEQDESEALLIMDAENVFNSVHHKDNLSAWVNVCTQLLLFPWMLISPGSTELESSEGIAQGNPQLFKLFLRF